MYRETQLRSVMKAISYRMTGSAATAGIVYAMTRKWETAAVVGGVEAFGKIVLYFLHERLWDRLHIGRRAFEPKVIWLTGLSGSGKTTIGMRVVEELRRRNLKAEFLDGDSVRAIFPKTGFSREERNQHVKRVGFLASRLEGNGVTVVASFVSPYREAREFVRGLCRNFVEIHVATPLEECERRDVKGLYQAARRGELRNFTGIDDPYEEPANPELRIDTREIPVERAVEQILKQVL
jgi:adenylylsulfate kinase